MAGIKLTDDFGLNLDVTPTPASCFARYFKSLPSLHAAGPNIRSLQNVPLRDFPLQSAAIGVAFQEPVSIGTKGPELTIGAGVSGTLGVYQKGSLFAQDRFGDPVPVLANQAYVSLGMTASVSADLGAPAGHMSFGVTPGTDVSVANYRPFTTTSSEPKFLAALNETLQEYCIPADIEDLKVLPTGTIVTLEGTGTLKFSATANLLSSVNPLATLALPVVPASLQVIEGASFKIAASFELSGGYQIRVQKIGQGTLRLAYYREHGSDLRVGVSANAGVGAGLGSFELISALLGAVSSNAQADIAELDRAGLNEDQITGIAAAIKAGIEKKLELAVSTELGLASQKEAAFLYEIDLDRLNAAGQQALLNALRADLSALVESEHSPLPGVRPVRSVLTSVREGRHRLKLNLLGIYNYISVSQLTLQGRILYEPESGDLVITDSANAERIQSSVVNFGADRDKLRRVLAESFLITAAYRGTRFVARAPQLNSTCCFFELQAKTTWKMMRDFLDVPQALGMLSGQQKQQILSSEGDFGRSTFYAETNYGDTLATALFLDQAGQPRSEDDYDKLGREALKCLIHTQEADAFRLPPLQDDSVWNRMRETVQAALSTVLPGLSPEKIAVLAADYTLIRWWSQSMRRLGEKLAEIRNFFTQNPNTNPEDTAFKTLRAELASDMASVTQNTKEEFGRPWGLLVMDRASGGKSGTTVRVIAGHLNLQLERAPATSEIRTAAAE